MWEQGCQTAKATPPLLVISCLSHPQAGQCVLGPVLRRREAGGLGGMRGLLRLHVLTQSEPDYTFTAEGRGHA